YADVVWANAGATSGTAHLALSTGSGFSASTSIGSIPSVNTGTPDCSEVQCTYYVRPTPFALGDTNGDGRADLVYAGAIRTSTGMGCASAVAWNDAWTGTVLGLAVQDMNGDGLADVVWGGINLHAPLDSIHICYSNGKELGWWRGVGTMPMDETGP